MTKKQKDQQEAIWELLSTEAAYIAKLHVIKKVYCLVFEECVFLSILWGPWVSQAPTFHLSEAVG